ncbi:MAG: hypothetical protein AB8G86_05010 [Saprospiraceae bacterium]
MKSKKTFKKKETNFKNDKIEVRIKERKKSGNKKFNKHNIYMLIEEEDDSEIDLYGYLKEDE